MNDVVAGISEKMIRRHPHVFGSVNVKDSSEDLVNWEKIKTEERAGNKPESLLSGVPQSLPALMRAAKLQEKAAGAGFDWPDYRGALDKAREEMSELEAVIKTGNPVKIEDELGDLLFSVVNLARLLGVEPEAALTGTSVKFSRRFNHVEKMAGLSGRNISSFSLNELDKWWEDAKKLEKI
jgi:tetrapyrrole methylase family protein/MazG family protein